MTIALTCFQRTLALLVRSMNVLSTYVHVTIIFAVSDMIFCRFKLPTLRWEKRWLKDQQSLLDKVTICQNVDFHTKTICFFSSKEMQLVTVSKILSVSLHPLVGVHQLFVEPIQDTIVSVDKCFKVVMLLKPSHFARYFHFFHTCFIQSLLSLVWPNSSNHLINCILSSDFG